MSTQGLTFTSALARLDALTFDQLALCYGYWNQRAIDAQTRRGCAIAMTRREKVRDEVARRGAFVRRSALGDGYNVTRDATPAVLR